MAKRSKAESPTAEGSVFPPFPSLDDLACSDEELGRRLLDYGIASAAEILGLPTDVIPTEFGEWVVRDLMTREASDVENAAVEKALRKAAHGLFAEAGRIVRAHFDREVAIEWAARNALIGLRWRTQVAEFGRLGGRTKKVERRANREQVLRAMREIEVPGTASLSANALAKRIAATIPMSVHTVRRHIGFIRRSLTARDKHSKG